MSNLGSILIIDRDSELTAILGSYLTTIGYRVVFTNRVREALRKLGNQKFAHIFIDPLLAPDNVNELYNELLTPGAVNKSVPVVLMTHDLEYQIPMDVAKRLKAILPKPFTLPEFALQLQVKGT